MLTWAANAGKCRTLTNVACLRPVCVVPHPHCPPYSQHISTIFAHKAMCYATLIGVYCEGRRDAWLCRSKAIQAKSRAGAGAGAGQKRSKPSQARPGPWVRLKECELAGIGSWRWSLHSTSKKYYFKGEKSMLMLMDFDLKPFISYLDRILILDSLLKIKILFIFAINNLISFLENVCCLKKAESSRKS